MNIYIYIYIYIYISFFLYFVHTFFFSSFGVITSNTFSSFLTVLVSSSFHFYLCPFLVIILSASLIDPFFFFHLLFSPFIFFHSFFRHFLLSIFPTYVVLLNVDLHLIFPTFFSSSLPVAFFKNNSK